MLSSKKLYHLFRLRCPFMARVVLLEVARDALALFTQRLRLQATPPECFIILLIIKISF